MISINDMPSFGFGNRLFYYNNLRQFAAKTGYDWSCCPWDGYQYFKGDLLNGSQVVDGELKLCLGEKFFEWSTVSTRSIFQLKDIPEVPEQTCAIHFRGTDFYSWNSDAVLDYSYYNDSVDAVKDDVDHFRLFTDDYSLPSFCGILDRLKEESISFDLGQNTADRRHFINDFSYMTECQYIISSPSTFCMAAGFVGREKKIIHSKNWVYNRADKDDIFWADLVNGGNKDYSIWKVL